MIITGKIDLPKGKRSRRAFWAQDRRFRRCIRNLDAMVLAACGASQSLRAAVMAWGEFQDAVASNIRRQGASE